MTPAQLANKRKIDSIDVLTDSDEENVSAKKPRPASTSGSIATSTTGSIKVRKNAPGGAESVKNDPLPLGTTSSANVDDQLASLLFPPEADDSS
ncbi:hypothetical protein JCM10296v2_001877 [Rhodotorula toruloides]